MAGPFQAEGPSQYQAAYKRNRPFAKPGPYATLLSPQEEILFRAWVAKNSVPFNPKAKVADYDMRGFWQAMQTGLQPRWQQGHHFPDTWKTPYDTSFSNESMYATKQNPFVWQGQNLVDRRSGRPLFQGKPEERGV